MKTMSQIGYSIDELLHEKANLKKNQIETKTSEFSKILTEMPPKSPEDLEQILKLFAQEIKYIVEQ